MGRGEDTPAPAPEPVGRRPDVRCRRPVPTWDGSGLCPAPARPTVVPRCPRLRCRAVGGRAPRRTARSPPAPCPPRVHRPGGCRAGVRPAPERVPSRCTPAAAPRRPSPARSRTNPDDTGRGHVAAAGMATRRCRPDPRRPGHRRRRRSVAGRPPGVDRRRLPPGRWRAASRARAPAGAWPRRRARGRAVARGTSPRPAPAPTRHAPRRARRAGGRGLVRSCRSAVRRSGDGGACSRR